MALRIPDNKIDEVRLAADIVEVISGYLPLKRRGRNYLALCPFHNEKTPSFSVSPDRQIFHCFGCGKGGNVFTFLMEHDKITFIEAVTALAERYGIALPRYEAPADTHTERLLYANQVAADFFQATLKNRKYQEKINQYLYQKRGLSPETVEEFKIGLAPDEWRGLLEYAQKKDITPAELAEAGLAIKSDKTNNHYDRFRLRLMIPIFNLSGKIVAFGGRALKKGEPAKYMNSPETPLYNKSSILYGLHASKGYIREAGAVILVEGYFDFLSLYQAGIRNVVAVSGTAFTAQQGRLLARFAQKAYLLFDADSAGQNAALRSIEFFFNAGIDPIIASPPSGDDPDTLVRREGAEGVQKILNQGIPYLIYRFKKIDPSAMTTREKEQVVKEIKSLAGKIDDTLRKDIFIASAADILKLPLSSLQPVVTDSRASVKMPEQIRNMNIIESEFLSLFMNRPPLIEQVWNEIYPDDLKGPGHAAIYNRMIEVYRAKGEINADQMIQQANDEMIKSGLSLIATFDWSDLDLHEIVKEYKRMILNQKRDAQLSDLKQRLAAAEKKSDVQEVEKLAQEIKYLLEKRH